MTEADHVTPACHVSRRKWGGKWPHCEYFLLSSRAGREWNSVNTSEKLMRLTREFSSAM